MVTISNLNLSVIYIKHKNNNTKNYTWAEPSYSAKILVHKLGSHPKYYGRSGFNIRF